MAIESSILEELKRPFHPSQVEWKPGAVKGDRALAIAYADLRAYMNRLDEVCGDEWSVEYEPWGPDRIICRLTIGGVTRSSTGETTNESEKNEIGGTVAEAQAFKRAAVMFGLGRYLYNLPSGWVDFDPQSKKFTDKAKAHLTGLLVQHYRRATESKLEVPAIYATEQDEVQPTNKAVSSQSALLQEFDALGQSLYGDMWENVCRRNVKRISGGKTEDVGELAPEQIQKLIDGMAILKSKGVAQSATVSPQKAAGTPEDSNGHKDASAPAYPPKYAALIDNLTGDCLERVTRGRMIHAQGKDGPSSPEQYGYLAGVIDEIVKQDKAHNAILEVFVGRAVSSGNLPCATLAGKMLDVLVKEHTVERDGKKVKVANSKHDPKAVTCIHTVHGLVMEADGQASLFNAELETVVPK